MNINVRRDVLAAGVLALAVVSSSAGFAAAQSKTTKTGTGSARKPAAVTSPVQSWFAANNVRVSNDFSLTLNNVSGDGKARSSLSEGLHYLEMLNLSGNGQASNGYDYTWTAGIKMTDDKRNDIKNFSFTNLQYRLSNDIHTLTAGDVLEYYSQYTLNSALKGLSWRYDQPNNALQQAGVVYGIAYPRWDSFYGGTEVKSILRHAFGGTVRGSFGNGVTAGVSLAQVMDDNSSRVFPTDILYNGGVIGFDAEYQPFQGLNLRSELALASITGSVTGAPATDFNGAAFKMEGTGSGGPSRVTLEYERVSPKFVSPLGAATPDRERIKTKWRYAYTRAAALNFGLLWYRNNLENTPGVTGTTVLRPEAGVSVRAPFNRPAANGDISYRIDLQNAGATKVQDHYLTLGYRDRYGDVDNDNSLGIALYSTEANIRKGKEVTFNTSFSSQFDLDDVVLRPLVSLGVWNLSDDLIAKTNRITEYSLGTGIEIPAANVTSRVRFGSNRLDAEAGDSSDKFFASGDVYWRPAFLERFNSGTLYLRALYNAYSYTTAANNFRESSITTGASIQF